ncbi:hypothetical protein B5M09_005091 [Aphanomyces astaci]|uniref:FAM86 N-terminal domain-containing protein n=1 Tax=Aphanomyces astaci TaxID=112090 RepID=A0A425D0E6_APHAT|nr:hypothetical protein B5M09_005091 [Aphanomyces astaci]
MAPMDQLMHNLKSCSSYLTLEFQDRFMQFVIQDPIADDFPPKQSYTFRLLRLYIQEILPNVCHKNASIGAIDLDELHHVTYRIPHPRGGSVDWTNDAAVHDRKNSVITCRVAAAHNEVGMKLWEAGFFLAEYVLSHTDVFRGQRVMELGAGVGFTGLVLASLPSVAAAVVLTDYAPVVMQNLRYNIEVNEHACRLQCPLVEAMLVDWTAWEWHDTPWDILIAGDCVYDVAAFPAMVHVLATFLDADQKKSAIFASTLRNQATFDAFLKELHVHAIDYDDITAEAVANMPRAFQYDNRGSIRLCRMTKAATHETI